MSEIVFCCGKVCSGKSTFSKILEDVYGYYYFSADHWMLHFYDETTDRQLFDKRLSSCTTMILDVSKKILAHDGSVILDFGFWRKIQRMRLRKEFEEEGYIPRLVYFPVQYDKQLEYMNKRQSEKKEKHYKFDDVTITELNKLFEEPDSDEGFCTKEDYLALLKMQNL